MTIWVFITIIIRNHNIFKNIIIFLKIKNLKISNIESDYKSIGIKDFEIKKNF